MTSWPRFRMRPGPAPTMSCRDAGVTVTTSPSPTAGPGVLDMTVSIDGRPGRTTEVNVTPRGFAFPRG